MTKEQEEAIRECNLYVQAKATIQLADKINNELVFRSCDTSAIETVLNLIQQLEREKQAHIRIEQQYKKEYLDAKAEIEKKDKEKQEWKKAYYEIKEKTSGIPNSINR